MCGNAAAGEVNTYTLHDSERALIIEALRVFLVTMSMVETVTNIVTGDDELIPLYQARMRLMIGGLVAKLGNESMGRGIISGDAS